MSEKRRSMLFPFHLGSSSSKTKSSTSKEGKFEVVNRKKSPLQMSQNPSASPTITSKSISTKPTSTEKTVKPTKPVAVPVKKERSPLSKENDNPLSSMNTPSSLKVDVAHIPPVPDYNSIRLDAPPVTIQGRTVSMISGKSVFKRKPPSIIPAPVIFENKESDEPKIETQTKDILSNETQSKPLESTISDKSLALQKNDQNINIISHSHHETEPNNQPIDDQDDYNDDSYSFSDNEKQIEEESTYLNIPGSFAQPGVEPVVDSGSNSSFYDAIEHKEVAGSQISFIKPLKIHQKTNSSATVPIETDENDTSAGHKKQLSLSDEILRDIQQFEPEFQTDEVHEESFDDINDPVLTDNEPDTPISPLRSHSRDVSHAEQTFNSLSIMDSQKEDEEIINTTDAPVIDSVSENDSFPLAQVSGTNRSTTLFKDSSDSESEIVPSTAFLGGAHFIPLANDRVVSNSSIAVEVHENNLHDQESTDNEFSTNERNGGLVRSDSLKDLSHELDDDKSDTEANLNQNFNFPIRSTGLHVVNNESSGDEDEDDVVNNDGESYGLDDSYEKDYNLQRSLLHMANDKSSLNEGSSVYLNEVEPKGSYTKFHVVNDGNYSDSSNDDNDSFDFADQEEELFHKEYPPRQEYPNETFITQQEIAYNPTSGLDSESEILSFTAKSPNEPHFNFDSTNSQHTVESGDRSSYDTQSSSHHNQLSAPLIAVGAAGVAGVAGATAMAASTSLTANYDRRNEPLAPVSYMSTTNKTRRPPPDHESTIATRSARSTSVSVGVPNVYNSIIREDEIEDQGAKNSTLNQPNSENNVDGKENVVPGYSLANHKPLTSSYVESIRFGSKLSNSSVPASKWGLPVGISQIDSAKGPYAPGARANYAKLRTSKTDLKHGKIKPRLLASEVDEEEAGSSKMTKIESSPNPRNSLDDTSGSSTKHSSDHIESHTQYTSSIFNPSVQSPPSKLDEINSSTSTFNASTPSGTNLPGSSNSVQRSGTLMTHEVAPVLQMGRHGSVRQSSAGMTLYIANPDYSDSD